MYSILLGGKQSTTSLMFRKTGGNHTTTKEYCKSVQMLDINNYILALQSSETLSILVLHLVSKLQRGAS
jgi:hypothetical protein